MVVATITITIAVAVGIRATIVTVQVTRGDSFTIPRVNAAIKVKRRQIALAHVEAFNTSLMVAVTIITTIATVTTMAVTAVEKAAALGSMHIARNASAKIPPKP